MRIGVEHLKKLLAPQQSWAAFARLNGQLIAYAFAVRENVPSCGLITWVTQMVVHTNFRNQGVATSLLSSIWGFSDHCGWGLVTANPYAVRALEKATRRRCTPSTIQKFESSLAELGSKLVPYIDPSKIQLTSRTSTINTSFDLDLSGIPDMLKSITHTDPWRLGNLKMGHEWFAFTFREQKQFKLTPSEFEKLLANSDRTVFRAYESMLIDTNHKWAKHWESEVEWIVKLCELKPGDRVLDFGCGNGRHSLELARKGMVVVGVDLVDRFIEEAKSMATKQGIKNVSFIKGDCRSVLLEDRFDAAICLYDVIGSHPIKRDNEAIVENLSRHLRPGGYALMSVMNMDLAKRLATEKQVVSRNPDVLLSLKPSRTMQDSGQIWNPNYFLIDSETDIVYRKEQFESPGLRLPCELIIRDRRYTIEELAQMCSKAGLEEIRTVRVRLGRWAEALDPNDNNGKELLYHGVKAD